jgi:hypothetical protein
MIRTFRSQLIRCNAEFEAREEQREDDREQLEREAHEVYQIPANVQFTCMELRRLLDRKRYAPIKDEQRFLDFRYRIQHHSSRQELTIPGTIVVTENLQPLVAYRRLQTVLSARRMVPFVVTEFTGLQYAEVRDWILYAIWELDPDDFCQVLQRAPVPTTDSSYCSTVLELKYRASNLLQGIRNCMSASPLLEQAVSGLSCRYDMTFECLHSVGLQGRLLQEDEVPVTSFAKELQEQLNTVLSIFWPTFAMTCDLSGRLFPDWGAYCRGYGALILVGFCMRPTDTVLPSYMLMCLSMLDHMGQTRGFLQQHAEILTRLVEVKAVHRLGIAASQLCMPPLLYPQAPLGTQ